MEELVIAKIVTTAIADPWDFTSITLDFITTAYFDSTYLDYMYDSPFWC